MNGYCEVCEFVGDVAKCGEETITDGAKCGWDEVKCAYAARTGPFSWGLTYRCCCCVFASWPWTERRIHILVLRLSAEVWVKHAVECIIHPSKCKAGKLSGSGDQMLVGRIHESIHAPVLSSRGRALHGHVQYTPQGTYHVTSGQNTHAPPSLPFLCGMERRVRGVYNKGTYHGQRHIQQHQDH